MTNIQRKYTLSNLALSLELSTSWINKVQKRTGIGGSTGKRGRKVYFDEEDMYIFRSVKLLRMLNYSLLDIKKIYEVEKRMLLCKAVNSRYKADKIDQGYHYIIHPYNFTYDEHLHPGKDVEEYDMEIAEYKKLTEFIYEISAEVFKRAKRLEDELKDFILSISKNVEADNILHPHI